MQKPLPRRPDRLVSVRAVPEVVQASPAILFSPLRVFPEAPPYREVAPFVDLYFIYKHNVCSILSLVSFVKFSSRVFNFGKRRVIGLDRGRYACDRSEPRCPPLFRFGPPQWSPCRLRTIDLPARDGHDTQPRSAQYPARHRHAVFHEFQEHILPDFTKPPLPTKCQEW